MRRREVLVLLGGAVAWPPQVGAEGEQIRRIGVLMSWAGEDTESLARVGAFRDALQKLGWTEGRNVLVEVRWAGSDARLTQEFARELVASRPDIILSPTTAGTSALLQHTRSIPVIFVAVSDPVGSGFVSTFREPGGNVTGFINVEPTMAGKWLELLKEIAPRVERIAFLFNPTTAPYAQYYLAPFSAAAASLRVEGVGAPVHDLSAIESTISELGREPDAGLVLMPDAFLLNHRAEIASLAARHGVPAIYPFRQFTEVGGLISYGNDGIDNCRRAAIYADRILKGAKPSELPVQAPVRFELVVNLKAANALGLEVPLQLQQRADEVIE
jgi:putative ABC transport system substrate-binding protein